MGGVGATIEPLVPTASRSPNESCAQKARLQRACSFAIADLNRAVQVLDHYVGRMQREEYERLRTFANRTRLKSEWTRRDLERHMAEHGC